MKRILFCADGTWNGPETKTGASVIDGQDDAGEIAAAAVTNVIKLFANLAGHPTLETLALQNEQEKTTADSTGNTAQVAKYVHGVGDSKNAIIKLLGGAFGAGLIARIVRGYTFISRNYEAGDEIHIVGFSRGAYTARALAGMIAAVGLLDPNACDLADHAKAYLLGISAWCKAKGVKLREANKWTDLANHFFGLIQDLISSALPDDAFIPNVTMKSVAVWDTVGSMGIPVYAGDRRYDMFRFADTALSPKVANGFHAMAIDEQRIDFPVTRWDKREGIRQVWFVGAHADVGGGYAPSESRLSDIALDWMIQRLKEVGVLFGVPPAYKPDTDADFQPIHKPWESPPFDLMPRCPREPGANDLFHESVISRWQTDPNYRPVALASITESGIDRLQAEEGSPVIPMPERRA